MRSGGWPGRICYFGAKNLSPRICADSRGSIQLLIRAREFCVTDRFSRGFHRIVADLHSFCTIHFAFRFIFAYAESANATECCTDHGDHRLQHQHASGECGAERSILGAILLDNFAYNQAAEHLRTEDFSLDSHRRIYSRMVDLAESSRPIDMITLIEELDRHKDLQPIGDVAYVSSLVDGVPDRPSIEHYVKIVRDKAMLRGLTSAASTADCAGVGPVGSGRGCF